jgi:hypothetical protein
MQPDVAQAPSSNPGAQTSKEAPKPVRLWFPISLVAVFWAIQIIVGPLDMLYFLRFLLGMAVPALLTLTYFIWWWTNRRIRLSERLSGFVFIVAGAAVAVPLCHRSMTFMALVTGVPIMLTGWTAWLLIVRMTGLAWTRLGSLVVVVLSWIPLTLLRQEGVNTDLKPDLHWRWTPTAEERFLAEVPSARTATESSREWDYVLHEWPGDWPGFRGPNRDGVIRGVTIATDWNTAPPRLLWRQRVGPAWSSMLVAGDRVGHRLFTQEQRGEQEAVVCYDAVTGKQRWVHEDTARFWEAVSGAGPRATPTFAGRRLYTLGATGILNCLDAASGMREWSRDITADTGAKPPMWGYSGSPLVTDRLVIVFAGGPGSRNVIAYHTETGEPAWTATAGQLSYSSPQLATVAGKLQVLVLSDHGLTALDPETGALLWERGQPMPGAPRCLQPHVLGETQLVCGMLEGLGVARIDVTLDGTNWQPTPRWNTTDLKPEFSDFVVHEGHAYGFDVSHFCCIDLETGKRCWKGDRYGRGQVMLLADQALLLVLSEKGDAILLPATPNQPHELARFHAIDGKTWNHPVIAHGRLYVRNAEEMACYELRGKGS